MLVKENILANTRFQDYIYWGWLIHLNTNLLAFSHLADNTQSAWKICVQGLQCRMDLALPQHIPWRETFPIKWQSPGRPPRSVKVKNLTPQKKVKEWVQNIPPNRVTTSDAILILTLGWQGNERTTMTMPCHPLMSSQKTPRGRCFTLNEHWYWYTSVYQGWWGSRR